MNEIKKLMWNYIYDMVKQGYTKDKAKEYLKQIVDKM